MSSQRQRHTGHWSRTAQSGHSLHKVSRAISVPLRQIQTAGLRRFWGTAALADPCCALKDDNLKARIGESLSASCLVCAVRLRVARCRTYSFRQMDTGNSLPGNPGQQDGAAWHQPTSALNAERSLQVMQSYFSPGLIILRCRMRICEREARRKAQNLKHMDGPHPQRRVCHMWRQARKTSKAPVPLWTLNTRVGLYVGLLLLCGVAGILEGQFSLEASSMPSTFNYQNHLFCCSLPVTSQKICANEKTYNNDGSGCQWYARNVGSVPRQ